MSAWIFKRKDTNNQDWFVVVSNGVTSRPLRRDLALGLVRKLDDDEFLKVFLAAREGWNAEQLVRDFVEAMAHLDDKIRFGPREPVTADFLKVLGASPALLRLFNEALDAMVKAMLATDELQAEDVTEKFHKDAYPKVFLVDGKGSDYMVVPTKDDMPKLVVGFDAAKATVGKFPMAAASQDVGPSGPRR